MREDVTRQNHLREVEILFQTCIFRVDASAGVGINTRPTPAVRGTDFGEVAEWSKAHLC